MISKMKEHQIQYLLQENSQIREEISQNIKEIATTEWYGLAASGAIWTWLLTQGWAISIAIAVCIPTLASWLLFRRREALSDAIKEKAQYIKRIEAEFDLRSIKNEMLGWEHRKIEKNFSRWSKIYWRLLIWGNFGIAVIYLATQYLF